MTHDEGALWGGAEVRDAAPPHGRGWLSTVPARKVHP